MEKNDVLKPIAAQISYWITYKESVPDFKTKPVENRKFRLSNDNDCILTNGNRLADIIFSLWNPFKRVLIYLNGDKEVWGNNITALKKVKEKLIEYLPPENPMVMELSKLFVLGNTRANVMILPPGDINRKRGSYPYLDYIPHFLNDSFSPGREFNEFTSNEHLKEWIEREHLEMLFNGEISRENIIDLLDCGSFKSPKNYSEKNIYSMFSMYSQIILKRREYYPDKILFSKNRYKKRYCLKLTVSFFFAIQL